jgi:glycosyl transferase family 2
MSQVWPSVSCICITRNRRLFLRQAVVYFNRSQASYPGDLEMVIVDSGEGWSFQTWPFTGGTLGICRLEHRPDLLGQGGKARNRACEIARNDIILHWDDDDWQHPERITLQVQKLLESPGDGLTRTHNYYGYCMAQRWACKSKTWQVPGGLGRLENTIGATFAYWKDTWRKTPFREDVGMAEDIWFQGDLRARGCPLLDAADPTLLVYMRHNQNASLLTHHDRTEADTKACRELIGADLDFYDGIGELLPLLKGRESPWHTP